MTETERQVLDVLDELERRVALMATAEPKPKLLPLFERLDELARQLGPATNPDLSHYLARKSYQKAHELLRGLSVEAPRGNCGR